MSELRTVGVSTPMVRHVSRRPPWRYSNESVNNPTLVWAARGRVVIEADGQTWLVRPTVGIWLPPATPHTLRSEASNVYFVEFRRGSCDEPGPAPAQVDDFARAAILRLVDPQLSDGERQRTGIALRDALIPPDRGTSLPMPADPRLREIARMVLADPSDDRTISEWGQHVGASVRTLTRRFRADTGLSFGEWRRQVRVHEAVELLRQGRTVRDVAHAVGYGNASAFAYAFRRATGHTPTAIVDGRPRSA